MRPARRKGGGGDEVELVARRHQLRHQKSTPAGKLAAILAFEGRQYELAIRICPDSQQRLAGCRWWAANRARRRA